MATAAVRGPRDDATTPPRGKSGGAAREGSALLQGLVRCGRCGRKMHRLFGHWRGGLGLGTP